MDVLDILIDALRAAILITGMVVLMMLMIESLNISSGGRFFARLQGSKFGQIVVSALLGWLPTAGPNMLVIGLFATGKLPAEALLVNSIVQDGHASLPLLAESRMQFFSVKLLKTLLALAVFALWKTL